MIPQRGFAAADTGLLVKVTDPPTTMTFGNTEAAAPQVIPGPLATIIQPSAHQIVLIGARSRELIQSSLKGALHEGLGWVQPE